MEIGGEESRGNNNGPAKRLPREQGLVQAKVEVAQVRVLARVRARRSSFIMVPGGNGTAPAAPG